MHDSVTDLKTRFRVPAGDRHTFSERDKEALARIYLTERSYRGRIDETCAGSSERRQLIGEMYEQVYDHMRGSDSYREYAGLTAVRDRRNDARAVLRVSGGERVLEIGCGQGALVNSLAREGVSVHGIDVVQGCQWPRIESEHAGRATFSVCAVDSLAEGNYDVVVADNVLEHIPPIDYQAALKRCYDLLAPGGWLVVLIPSPLTGPHDCSRWFLELGVPAQGGHFMERRSRDLVNDFGECGLSNLKTTIAHRLSFGRFSLGWSRLWTWRALMMESLCVTLPARFRSHPVFKLTIPRILAGQKAG